MISITTTVYKDHGPEGNQNPENPPAWRVQSCKIEFGPDREPLTFTSDWVYASADAACEDMQEQALDKIRMSGYPWSAADIVWRVHMIG